MAAGPATHYQVLGVESEATDREIKQAYRRLVVRCHPDKDPSAGAGQRFQQIQRAYDALSDPVQRSRYNDALASGRTDGDDHSGVGNLDRATALMLAAAAGRSDEVRELLAKGCQVDEVDSFDRTALMYGATAGHAEVIDALLLAQARLDLRDSEGMTPFLCAAGGRQKMLELRRGTLACLRTMLTAKADVNESSLKGYSALTLACNGGSFVAVHFLLSNGAIPDKTSALSMSPLCIVAHRGNIKVLDALLAARADANLPSESDGETALMVASSAGHEAVAARLLESGANAKLFMHDGGSALLAVIEEHADGRVSVEAARSVVKLLLEHNAEPLAATMDGRTPLKVAARNTAQHHGGAWLEDLLSSEAVKQSQQTGGGVCQDCLAGFRIMFGLS